MGCLVTVVAEYAQQVEEEVDEVEIKTQGSNQRELLCALACVGGCLAHLLDLLGVVSGETYEYEHANVAQDEVEPTACHAIAPNVPAVMKNTLLMVATEKAKNIDDSVAPLITE